MLPSPYQMNQFRIITIPNVRKVAKSNRGYVDSIRHIHYAAQAKKIVELISS